jgi:beta-glucosidase
MSALAHDERRYMDPVLPVDERVRDLMQRMTVQEKLAQLGSAWAFEVMRGTEFEPTKARKRIGTGIGQITRVAGATDLPPSGVVELANRIQRFLVEETRLGIPAIVHEECLHGFVARDAICYPQSIGQASTWDPELIEAMAHSIGRQLRAAGAHQGLAPILDVARDPRWGRIEETFGEDPYLVAALGVAYVRGLQGDGPIGGASVLATAKHMVGHGVPEGGLNHAPAHIGERELRDVFLFPFEAVVRVAGVGSVMHAYDDLDGVPCVTSKELFTRILRERWGFGGFVVADYAGIHEILRSHALVSELDRAATLALEAGIDVELPSTDAYGAPLAHALDRGYVDPAIVDQAVARILRAKFELGVFEYPYVGPDVPRDAEADRALAQTIARRSLVLVQNDGVLPLQDDLGVVAVIGPNADSARNMLGDYSYTAHIETLIGMRDGANPFGFPIPEDLDLGMTEDMKGRPTILSAIRDRIGPASEVRFAPGCNLLDGTDDLIEEAVAVASGADVAILVVGERSGLTDDCTCGEARDRWDLGLLGRQEELVAAVAATGTPIVLIVVSGRPLSLGSAVGRSSAVLLAWVPGDEGPAAIAEVLFGDESPGGKLPVTIPRHVGQVPIYYAHKPSGGRSHWKDDYVDGSHRPLWPFGHGLSYTRFELSGLEVDRPTVKPDGQFTVEVNVANVGERAGDEVVQLYVRDLEASVTRPVKELRGFARLHLEPGERRRVSFRVAAEQLAFTDLDGDLVVEPGVVRIMVGTSSVNLPCSMEVEIVGEARTIERRTRYISDVAVE